MWLKARNSLVEKNDTPADQLMGIINSNLMTMRKEQFSWPLNVQIVPISPSRHTGWQRHRHSHFSGHQLRIPGKLRGQEPSAVNTHAHAVPVQLWTLQTTLSPRQKRGLTTQLDTDLLHTGTVTMINIISNAPNSGLPCLPNQSLGLNYRFILCKV